MADRQTRIELLKPTLTCEENKSEFVVRSYLRYGHIIRGENHYQFYFDFIKLTRDSKAEIKKWAKSIAQDIEQDAYNIVISPLQTTNSEFLKTVADNVFGSNLHMLHIEIGNMSKESIRTKFGYISEELKRISQSDKKVNFYFIDDSICTGNSLARAHKFLLTICSQAQIELERIIGKQGLKFKKVFLLINRSSYETALSWVDDPVNDWYGFINICVPSYNTRHNTCPGCKVHDRSEILSKRCATNELAAHFDGDAEKHILRNPHEYDLWRENKIRTSPHYFDWLRVWLYYNKDKMFESFGKEKDGKTKNSAKKIKRVFNTLYDLVKRCGEDVFRGDQKNQDIASQKDDEGNKSEWKKYTLENFFDWLEKNEIADAECLKKNCLCLMHFIVADDNYVRLATMNDGYMCLVYDKALNNALKNILKPNADGGATEINGAQSDVDVEKFVDVLESKIWKILSDAIGSEDNKSYKDLQYENVFKTISYIKVLSRDYIAKNYYIRKAVMRVLLSVLDVMLDTHEKLTDELTKLSGEQSQEPHAAAKYNFILRMRNVKKKPMDSREINSVLQYRLTKIVIHRLALLRCEKLFEKEFMYRMCGAYKETIKSTDNFTTEEKIFISLPQNFDMIRDYVSSIKIATMDDSDDIICYKLLKNINDSIAKFREDDAENQDSVIVNEAFAQTVQWLYVENTRALYDFMDDISDRCTNLAHAVNSEWYYAGYRGKGGLTERNRLVGCENGLADKIFGCISKSMEISGGTSLELYQNPLTQNFKFYKEMFEKNGALDGDRKHYNYISEMLNCYYILQFLTEPQFKAKRHGAFESLPYIFEDICFSFRNMTDSRSCYMVYKKEGECAQLVARSGYVVDENEEYSGSRSCDRFTSLHLGALELDSIINSAKDDAKDGAHTDSHDYRIERTLVIKDLESVVKISITYKDYKHYFIVFNMPWHIGEPADSGSKKLDGLDREFYLMLDFDEEKIDGKENVEYKKDLNIFISVLFLRNKLQKALKKYYAGLLNFRYYCNYVQSVASTKETPDIVPAMHISDLHVKDDDAWNATGYRWEELKRKLEKIKKIGNIDFLAVTGDVIDAAQGPEAAVMQNKYKRAENLLFRIAKKLWGLTEGNACIMPHDWRRRIWITTGNHDYAAMNDVSVQNVSRQTTVALPSSQVGGTMSRYTYFIEFLNHFLDAPTKRLLSRDLNEVRDYTALGFQVGIFNTCSGVNAMQNNKVAFNNEEVKNVLKDSLWTAEKKLKMAHLVLMHHKPKYTIDYFEDKYELWNPKYKLEGIDEARETTFEELYKSFVDILFKKLDDRGYLSDEEIQYSYKNSDGKKIKEEDWCTKFADFKKKIENLRKTPSSGGEFSEKYDYFINSVIYKDMNLFYKILEKYRDKASLDEYDYQLLTRSVALFHTQYEDQIRFNSVCDEITLGCTHRLTVLAGHEHKNYQENNVYVIGKLYDEWKNGKISIDVVNILDGQSLLIKRKVTREP